MKSYYEGLDVLRGIGIMTLLVLHTAFYHFDGIYDIDLNNPSPIITIIGFLLMFAGLFAMISGLVHTVQYQKRSTEQRRKYMIISGLLLLVVAYLYFIFTGPGLIDFETRSMDESLFVSLINQGAFQPVTLERLLYVDSLVMLGLNVILLSAFLGIIKAYEKSSRIATITLASALLLMAVSYSRILLYGVYLNARDDQSWFTILILNFLANKNNPILPFFAFALYGSWIARLLNMHTFQEVVKRVIPISIIHLVFGVIGYVLTPETMLERAIDPTWYFIMVMQVGLFMLFILGMIKWFDVKQHKKACPVKTFVKRFGIAGLTPFFLESVVSAAIILLIRQFIDIEFSIPGAILYGVLMMICWGFLLMAWEKINYRYGIEWAHTQIVKRFGFSTKSKKLRGEIDD